MIIKRVIGSTNDLTSHLMTNEFRTTRTVWHSSDKIAILSEECHTVRVVRNSLVIRWLVRSFVDPITLYIYIYIYELIFAELLTECSIVN